MELDRCRPANRPSHPVLQEVHTPLKVVAWREALSKHPDQVFACYMMDGFSEGFGVSFDRSYVLTSANQNLLSVMEQDSVHYNFLK